MNAICNMTVLSINSYRALLSIGQPALCGKLADWPQRSRIYIANASRRSVRLEWIDFDGNTKAYGVELRPTDHKTEYTYAGHVWRIVDDKTGRVLHYFVTPKAPGKVVIKD